MDDPFFVSQLSYLRLIAWRFCKECRAAGMEPDDLAHETLLKARQRMELLPTRESDRQRYLYRLMGNLLKDCLDAVRAEKRGGGRVGSLDEFLAGMAESSVRLEMLIAAPGPGPRTLAQRREIRTRIVDAISSLPDEQRTAVTLHLVHEFTLEETSRTMERSEGQVRGYVQRGRARLQEVLRDLHENRI